MINASRVILMIAVLILFLPLLSLAGKVNLPETGQTICYDEAGDVITCTDAGQDGDKQAGVAWPTPRFTNPDGPTPITGDVVLDQLTGLMWTRDANLPRVKKTWQDALAFVAGLNVGGLTDWRLPNVNELESLVNAGETNTATWLNNQGFTNVQGNLNDIYWSSTWRDVSMLDVFGIDMRDGMVAPSMVDPAIVNYVWSVRAGQMDSSDPDHPANIWKTGQTKCFDNNGVEVTCAGTGQDGEVQAGVAWPSSRFTNPDGSTPITGDVILDQLTGLMWLKDANCIKTKNPSFDNDGFAGDGAVFWQDAHDFVAGINNGTFSDCGAGFTDWRLSNRKELRSLYNYADSLPGGATTNAAWLNQQGFSNVQEDNYWTSTTISDSTDMGWRITLADKELAGSTKDDSDHFVWPVRAYGNSDISVSPTSHDFGSVNVGSSSTPQTFAVNNVSDVGLIIGTLGITGADASEFSIQNDNCSGQTVASGSCTVDIVFPPASEGIKSAKLSIPSNDPDTPTLDVPLSGIGGTCTYSISPISQPFSSDGGMGSVSVTVADGCDWAASSNASWITITSGSTGSGNGAVNYSVSSNTSTSLRTGTMTIAGKTFTATQSGVGASPAPEKRRLRPARSRG